jgi:hypothetical protein
MVLAQQQKKRQAQKQQAEKLSRQHDEEQRREKLRLQQQIDAFLAALPDDERESLIQTAIAKCAIGRKLALAYHEGNNDPLDQAYYAAAISNYVVPLLTSTEAAVS